MASKPPILPGAHHLVVFVPTEEHPDVSEFMTVESKCWMAKSYDEAIRIVEDHIMSDEFVVDVECRFEVFDEFLDAVGDQKLFMDLIQARWDLEMGNEGDPMRDMPPPDIEDVEKLFGERDIHVPTKAITYTPAKPEQKPREVKFDDIRVEDNRK